MKAHRPQPPRIPTTEKLAQALEAAGAPAWMIAKARAGIYDDYKTDVAMPIVLLVEDCRANGLPALAQRALEGDFDAQAWEADAWAESPEGQETFRQFLR